MARADTAKNTPVKKTIRLFGQYKWFWIGAGVIAAAVDWLLSLGSQSGGMGRSLWIVIVFAGFLWAARKLSNTRSAKPAVKHVFYDGSGAFIKQLLVMLFWSICLVPFLLGSVVFQQINSLMFFASGIEKTIAFIGWLLLAAISAFLILRTVFAPVLTQEETPWNAIRSSWRLTKRRVRRLAISVLGSFLVMLLPIVLIYYATLGGVVMSPLLVDILNILADALVFLLVLPFMSMLIYQLYVYETRTRTRR